MLCECILSNLVVNEALRTSNFRVIHARKPGLAKNDNLTKKLMALSITYNHDMKVYSTTKLFGWGK
jgi:hypothetical protein